ncbi:hypothetical protein [uncultured Campylobacter sp.]|nr:hypothetical protein [uncultured Campylobacter sp.]
MTLRAGFIFVRVGSNSAKFDGKFDERFKFAVRSVSKFEPK